jgi:predicted Rossmann fold flavoprotein
MQVFDVVVLGAGAAGLYCAANAGRRELRVLLVDHAAKFAEKIRISGGGRCNFTNRDCTPANFVSQNPRFCRSALARHTPADFIALVERHHIAYHEKHRGQLFCDGSSEQIVQMLLHECGAAGVVHWQPCQTHRVRRSGDAFEIDTARGTVRTAQVVVATGGLSIPKIGATDFGYRVARQFGHEVIEPRPALVPLTFDATTCAGFSSLAGVSLEVGIECVPAAPPADAPSARKPRGAVAVRFVEDLLFTHRGLSGPAVLQASSFWHPGAALSIDLAPGRDLVDSLTRAKAVSRRHLDNELGQVLPLRLAVAWLQHQGLSGEQPMPQVRDRDIRQLADALRDWRIVPSGSEGWRKAEVTAGGVDTRELGSHDMQSRRQPGLFFIGEVLDVTGWLGGYNFQWAWASAAACARSLRPPGR